MRIYTRAGDLAFKTFVFPDGQPHIKIDTHEIEFRSVTVETAIRNPSELFQTLLVNSVLRQQGYSEVYLDIRYLLGARMDRAIGENEPFTLECVARLINGCGFSKVRILDVHSDVATRLIRNSSNVLPVNVLDQVRATLGNPDIVSPDKGATQRVFDLIARNQTWVIQCSKVRDPATGRLTNFKVHQTEGYSGRDLLIVDDICDGGATFTGLATKLREGGAKHVHLFVTHGIFSKGLPLDGIDRVFTTNSYFSTSRENPRGEYWLDHLTVIPVSMKDL